MSNTAQYLYTTPTAESLPNIGSTAIFANTAHLLTLPNGSKWISNSWNDYINYSAEYSGAVGFCTFPYTVMPGIFGNYFPAPVIGNMSIAYRPASTLYVTNSILGHTNTNVYSYYTLVEGGSWVKRTAPNSTNIRLMTHVANKFIGVAQTTTTNGIIYGTDGINWTSVNSPISGTPVDIAYNGTNLVLVFGSMSTCAYSTDGGASWTSVTMNTTPPGSTVMPGMSWITWNAGAGLFITLSGTGGIYSTSPDGITWTARNSQATYLKYGYQIGSTALVASSPTKTVLLGTYGMVMTTTDGLTWTTPTFVDSGRHPSLPMGLYWDGVRFVASIGMYFYYSTDGASWTKGPMRISNSAYTTHSNGMTLFVTANTNNVPGLLLRMTDVTDNTPRFLMFPTPTAVSGTVSQYMRVK